ncbi:MAG: hypothetical protein PVJ40_09440 [Gammaproteobacteria bacterium]|jgi:hypothetical protein
MNNSKQTQFIDTRQFANPADSQGMAGIRVERLVLAALGGLSVALGLASMALAFIGGG